MMTQADFAGAILKAIRTVAEANGLHIESSGEDLAKLVFGVATCALAIAQGGDKEVHSVVATVVESKFKVYVFNNMGDHEVVVT